MAKIIATFDTVDKTLSVSLDGKILSDVINVGFGKVYDYKDGEYQPTGNMNCYIEMCEEMDDMKVHHSLRASESVEGQEAVKKGYVTHKDFPEFVLVSSKSHAEDKISNYISQYLQ